MAAQGEQASIRCVIMRGGTSKGLYFHAKDLPPHGPRRDRLLGRLMGSPDVLQIDGLGGSRPITSKVAIIAPSERDDADVDYTFAQVDIESRRVLHGGNCGNISSGVGPFAVDEGLVPLTEGTTRVRIYNTGTGAIMVADVPVRNGQARVDGELAIPGVPGTGAEIVMNWTSTVGARTGHLLPTGAPADVIPLENRDSIKATLCDVGNPVVWVAAEDLGLGGGELGDAIHGDVALMRRLQEIRGKAAVLLKFCDEWRCADELSPGLPMVGMVAPPDGYQTLSGGNVAASEIDLRVRLMFMGRLHESIAGTGSVCLAAASRVEQSVVRAVVASASGPTLRIGHPSGAMSVRVEAHRTKMAPFVRFDMLGVGRTARRLAQCIAFYPRTLLDDPLEAAAEAPAETRQPALAEH